MTIKNQIERILEKKPIRITANIHIDEDFQSLDYFRDAYPTAQIESINGFDVLGRCVRCERILLDGDAVVDCTDEMGCAECFSNEELKKIRS